MMACGPGLLRALAGALLASLAFQAPPEAAYLVVELPSGRERSSAHPEILERAVLPGSIAKVAVLAAALESGVVTPRTALQCRRDVTADGHRLSCVHPDLGRPLTGADALAHSCNSYFAAVAARLSRGALNASRVAFGLGALDSDDPLVASALGLDGPRVTPRVLVRVLVRLALEPDAVALRPETRAILIDGLRGAAAYGTASALGDLAATTLAKTGTAPMPGGGFLGLVVAVHQPDSGLRPGVPSRPAGGGAAASPTGAGLAVVVVAPGASGRDAAAIARDLLKQEVAEARGAVRVGEATPSGYRVTALPLEEYVARAVEGEADQAAPPAALEAQAVVARTFALANRGQHANYGFDVCDLTHCQALRPAGGAARVAAAATSGRVLTAEGRPVRVWFGASCGGRTALAREIWPGADAEAATYLAAREESECERASRWRVEIAERDLVRAMRAAGLRGESIRSLSIVARTASGRVARVRLDGLDPAELPAETFRLAIGRALGWNLLRSHRFAAARSSQGYVFEGSGFGHGVGLCLLGARRMAASGAPAEDILRAYFPGAAVQPAAAGTASRAARIELPESDERERMPLVAMVDRAIEDLSTSTGVGPPAALTLRFHPTVESFRRSTGRPWWVAGSTEGARIELLPAPVLRVRGTLETTVRHELAHALLDGELRGRPLWVREGAAMYFAGERPPEAAGDAGAPVGSTLGCPSDAEIEAGATPEAMRAVYQRAAACFAREMAAGKAWRAVGGAGRLPAVRYDAARDGADAAPRAPARSTSAHAMFATT